MKVSTPDPPRWPFPIEKMDPVCEPKIYVYSEDEYLMISELGVLSVSKNKMELTSLERWEEEYNTYCKLIRIPFFAHFRMLKPFYVWRKKICDKKIHLAKEFLRNNLFFANQVRDNDILYIFLPISVLLFYPLFFF